MGNKTQAFTMFLPITGHDTQKSRKFKKNQKPEFSKNPKMLKKQLKIRREPPFKKISLLKGFLVN